MNEYRELYSDEAEHALLGSLMLDGELFDSITASVTTADFHDPENAALYQVMIDLHATGAPVRPCHASRLQTLPTEWRHDHRLRS